jgi:hypothetical protein
LIVLSLVRAKASFLRMAFGGLGPHERLGVRIVAFEVVMDGFFQVRHAREDAPSDASSRDFGEEALDEIEPGGTRQREVEVEAGMLSEPRGNPPFLTGFVARTHTAAYSLSF